MEKEIGSLPHIQLLRTVDMYVREGMREWESWLRLKDFLDDQSHFPGFFLSPESHLMGFCKAAENGFMLLSWDFIIKIFLKNLPDLQFLTADRMAGQYLLCGL